ncbi:MAG: DNA-binding protein WhiA [Ruminococcaceae bacterium]|nr:DNA-binding protein WhiA [Oscillospiraceae bacterium]
MNYSLALKDELIDNAPRAQCCRRAYADGLLYDVRELRENCLVLVLSGAAARRECAKAFREQYHRTALLNNSILLFPSEQLYEDYKKPPKLVCQHCAGHFLRGLIISCGSATDPTKAYHLEFRLSNPEKVPFLADFFEKQGWHAGCRTLKGGGLGIYFKNSVIMEEILTMTGSNKALFDLMNAKIEREIRNSENRVTNCETSNIARAVDASARIRDAITFLMATDRLAALSGELRETANLRMEHPTASMKELAHLHNPPITKSGLNHRLQKILAAGEAARREQNEEA